MAKKVKIVISEPWDFEIPGRENRLIGEIRGKVYYPYENSQFEYFLIKIDQPFELGGFWVKELLATERYKGESIDDILKGEELSVNLDYVNPGKKMEVGFNIKAEDATGLGIGTIKLIE